MLIFVMFDDDDYESISYANICVPKLWFLYLIILVKVNNESSISIKVKHLGIIILKHVLVQR